MIHLSPPWTDPNFYRRNLPHFDPQDAPYFLTYRLYGSIPRSEQKRLYDLYRRARDEAERWHFFLEYEAVLHSNGPHHLLNPGVQSLVADSLHFLESRGDLQLNAFSIMSNHVHAVFDVTNYEKRLRDIMQSHKSFTGRAANRLLGVNGKFWQRESYDHVVRSGRLGALIHYTLNNPVKAGYVGHWRDWPGNYLAPNIYGFD